MYCTNFIFDGESLSDYGMIICTIDSNGNDAWSGGDVTFVTQKAPNSEVQTFYTSSCETPLSCDFDICKNPCLSHDVPYITQEEYSALSRFLIRRDGYHWLQFDNEGYEDVFFNAQFNLQPKEIGGQTIGFTCSVTTDSPYGYSRFITKKYSLSSKNNIYKLINYSDKTGILYPTLKIAPKSDGNISLESGSLKENCTTVIKNVKQSSIVVLDGNYDYYEGISNPNNFNHVFPFLANSYHDRNTYIKLLDGSVDCDVVMEYRYIRMVTV